MQEGINHIAVQEGGRPQFRVYAAVQVGSMPQCRGYAQEQRVRPNALHPAFIKCTLQCKMWQLSLVRGLTY